MNVHEIGFIKPATYLVHRGAVMPEAVIYPRANGSRIVALFDNARDPHAVPVPVRLY